MVNSQAFMLVPGWKLSCFAQARMTVSCTRSSARSGRPVSDIAKARSEGSAASIAFLKLGDGSVICSAGAPPRQAAREDRSGFREWVRFLFPCRGREAEPRFSRRGPAGRRAGATTSCRRPRLPCRNACLPCSVAFHSHHLPGVHALSRDSREPRPPERAITWTGRKSSAYSERTGGKRVPCRGAPSRPTDNGRRRSPSAPPRVHTEERNPMSLSTRIAPHLPYLRRYSRAITGS